VAVYLDSRNAFHRDGSANSLECPHCAAVAHMSLIASPDFAQLKALRPNETGLVLSCDSCNQPVFLRYRVREYRGDQIEFYPRAQEVEKPPESFSFNYLPEKVAAYFKDALGCYSNGLMIAFPTLCKSTAQAVFADLGERGKLRIFDQVAEVQKLGEIDDTTFNIVRRVIFDSETNNADPLPIVTRAEAAVLLETMKDMLYQAYIRKGKLRKALSMRRFFAEQAEPHPDESFIVRAMDQDKTRT